MKFQEAETELLEEHAKRYAEVLKLSVAAAFGALFFLLQFEGQISSSSIECSCLLEYAWACFLLSALLGTVALSLWVAKPKTRLAELNIVRDQNGQIVEVKIESRVPWYEFASYWAHIFLFVAGVALLSWIKFSS